MFGVVDGTRTARAMAPQRAMDRNQRAMDRKTQLSHHASIFWTEGIF